MKNDRIMRNIIFISALLLFIAGTYLGYLDKEVVATSTYATGILCLIFVFLPEFKKFKGLGIEAELLDNKIKEADEILSKLRNLLIPMSEMLISTTARMGRWGTIMPRRQKYALIQRIEDELKNCGVKLEQLEAAKHDWYRLNIFDMVTPITNKINDILKKKHSSLEQELRNIKSPTQPDNQKYLKIIEDRKIIFQEQQVIKNICQDKDLSGAATKIKNYMSGSKALIDEEKRILLQSVKEELLDVEYYIEHKQFRRLDVWLDGDNID